MTEYSGISLRVGDDVIENHFTITKGNLDCYYKPCPQAGGSTQYSLATEMWPVVALGVSGHVGKHLLTLTQAQILIQHVNSYSLSSGQLPSLQGLK